LEIGASNSNRREAVIQNGPNNVREEETGHWTKNRETTLEIIK